MSVLDNLVYDRTQADYEYALSLIRKWLVEGREALTPAELAAFYAGLKGTYNAVDMNRVGEAVEYLADEFTELPVTLSDEMTEYGVADDTIFHLPYDESTITVTAKQSWHIGDIPTQAQKNAYLADLTLLRSLLTLPSDAPNVPVSLDNLSIQTANDIEYLLRLIGLAYDATATEYLGRVHNAANAFVCSGEVCCGE